MAWVGRQLAEIRIRLSPRVLTRLLRKPPSNPSDHESKTQQRFLVITTRFPQSLLFTAVYGLAQGSL